MVSGPLQKKSVTPALEQQVFTVKGQVFCGTTWREMQFFPKIPSCSLIKIVFSVFINFNGVAAAWPWSNSEERPHIQGQRRSPSKMVEGAKSCLELNPIPTRDAQRAQTAGPLTPQRLSQNCFSVSCRGMGQQWPAAGAGALGAADLGMK